MASLLSWLGLGREGARGVIHAKGLAREARRKAKSQTNAWVRKTNTSNRPSSISVIAIHMLPIKTQPELTPFAACLKTSHHLKHCRRSVVFFCENILATQFTRIPKYSTQSTGLDIVLQFFIIKLMLDSASSRGCYGAPEIPSTLTLLMLDAKIISLLCSAQKSGLYYAPLSSHKKKP